MSHNPDKYGEFTNELGQKIEFYEHPFYGDEAPVILVFPEHELAFDSDFFDIEDMTYQEEGVDMDYVPRLVDGECLMKFETED